MTGLEKMKNQILEEARAAAEEKQAEARGKAEAIIAGAREEAEKKSAAILKKSEESVKNYEERILSSNDLQRRTQLLAAKQEVITEVLDKAYASFETMDTDSYFQMMLKMVEAYAQPGEGEMFFSARDLERLPADFAERAQNCARQKGGAIHISEVGRPIENGFILAYGGIEENCTLKAMFHAKRDELSDKIHPILFS